MQNLHDNAKVVLLTLPRSDVGPKSTTTTAAVSSTSSTSSSLTANPSSSSPPPPPPPLLLLQLPPGWNARDLKGSRFVAARNSSHTYRSNQQQQHQQQPAASLVVERKRISFSLQRVETSNALVLVPPHHHHHHLDNSSSRTTGSNNNNNNNKRLKVSNDNDNTDNVSQPQKHQQKPQQQLQVVATARLLNHGSGAWFLEGKPQPLVLQRLYEALQQHVYNCIFSLDHDGDDDQNDNSDDDEDDIDDSTTTTAPTKSTVIVGRTVESLALEFQCTLYEIHVGLSKLEQAFLLPSATTTPSKPPSTRCNYCGFLSEQASLVVREAILATLLEEDDFGDYATTGVTRAKMIQQVVRRLQETRRPQLLLQQHAECLARHGILQLQNHENDNGQYDDQDEIRLNVTKVAVWVARRLLTTQKSSTAAAPRWDEQQAFMIKWQSQMPGVGKVYTVHWSMLRGIAILVCSNSSSSSSSSVGDVVVDDNDNTHDSHYRIHYLPRDQLPTHDAAAYMAQLFAAKERWELTELQPYLEYLCDFTATSPADILLQYTKIVTGDVHVKR